VIPSVLKSLEIKGHTCCSFSLYDHLWVRTCSLIDFISSRKGHGVRQAK
jgi:hypothetical protein